MTDRDGVCCRDGGLTGPIGCGEGADQLCLDGGTGGMKPGGGGGTNGDGEGVGKEAPWYGGGGP